MNSPTPEEQFVTLLAQMTPTQRANYLAQLPKKDTSKDAIALPQVSAAKQMPHLPLNRGTSQLPLVRSIVDQKQVERGKLAIEALHAAFGDQIPRLT